ncbi:MAG: YihA family ribosome biogenesis GTP-binding protein [Bacteroidetes bacterium]|nr:MAG: YihA family ribosome biogenesis GTP-binding protein [Bacteroidota bacterium]
MSIKTANFVKSSPEYQQCPPPTLPEYAFIGRSNVGKSSLINMIVAQKDMAKTSGKPGKTQLINHFLINEQWYLVDLPGYGYAKVSKEKKKTFGAMIENYLLERKSLRCVFVLIDIRLEMQKNDQEFMRWLGECGIPFVLAFTKCDKLSKNGVQKAVQAYEQEMFKEWEEMPTYFVSSANTNQGQEEILAFIDQINQQKS